MADWRKFDPRWFRRRWPLPDLPADDRALQDWQRQYGRHLAPNPFLEPAAGRAGLQRSRHWLFEPRVYLAQLQARGISPPADPYAHFLARGDRAGLRPGWFFSAAILSRPPAAA